MWLALLLGLILSSSSHHRSGRHSSGEPPECEGQGRLPLYCTPSASPGHLLMRLRGGGSIDPRTGFRAPINTLSGRHSCPAFIEIVKQEGAEAFFSEAEIAALRIFYGKGDNSEVPIALLGELRSKISDRRDKLSRALVSGGVMSESDEAEEERQQPRRVTFAQPLERKRNAAVTADKKGGIGGVVSVAQLRKGGEGMASGRLSAVKHVRADRKRRMSESSPIKRSRDVAESDRADKGGGEAEAEITRTDRKVVKQTEAKQDLLHYNPSVKPASKP